MKTLVLILAAVHVTSCTTLLRVQMALDTLRMPQKPTQEGTPTP